MRTFPKIKEPTNMKETWRALPYSILFLGNLSPTSPSPPPSPNNHGNASLNFLPFPLPSSNTINQLLSLPPPTAPPVSMAGQAAPWLLISLSLSLSTITVHSLGAEEGEALLRFKATLSIDLNSWIPGPAPCFLNSTTWEGVICSNSRVWGIQLENRGLVGTLDLRPLIPLPALRTISFMGNELGGPLPPDLNRLGALKAVYLSGNNFSGEIPADAFAGMRSLKKLFLSKNGFDGPIPGSLVSLDKLLELRLDHNEFAGGLPEFAQPRLAVVDVSFNRLEGAIPHRLSRMNPAFFQGNQMLCGSPLTVTCNRKTIPAKHGVSPAWLLYLSITMATIFSSLLLVLLLLLIRKNSKIIGRPFYTAKQAGENLEQGAAAKHRHHTTAARSVEGKSTGGRKSEYGKLSFIQQGGERFDINDLLRASAEVLGSGNFGSSFKAVLSAGPSVVVKRFKEMNRLGREEFSEHMRRLGRLSHPNLLPLIAYHLKKEEKLLITEFIPNGSLAHMLHGNRGSTLPPLYWPTRLKVVKGVARGLAYLYDELSMLTLPHGHLKSSNVLLDESFDPLLTDYALVPVMNLAHATQVMVAYKSPEVSQSGQPSKKSDVWSLGILILEILTGKFPANFLHTSAGGTDLSAWVSSVMEEEWNSEVFDPDMRGTENGESEMQKLLKIGLDCCEENIEKRIEMREALERIEELKEREG
ncbi:pollen receptor-like kinase 4 [Phalaenopsis equestris]|uniref:pollen receptor-like kinase 4 n=1 Tax=Phalaenopsis equestris TaxID=78828 RepID=UPI0009E498EE|nr:pollen receptor-like kinase 4 [Phalaenopsis equestris]